MAHTQSEEAAYFEALGRFIHWFAVMESMVLSFLSFQSGVKARESAALFSGVRIDQARDLINRLYDARDQPRPASLKDAFDQIGTLTKARNDLVHFGALGVAADGGHRVSNIRQAHVAAKYREWSATPAMLNDMAHDAQKAWLTIGVQMFGEAAAKKLLQLLNEARPQLPLGPWRYKPPPPSAPDQVPPALRPGHKPPPASWQASLKRTKNALKRARAKKKD